jgi:hypothetical protein
MLDKIVTFSFSATLAFCIFKFIEMKWVNKEVKPLKYFVRDVVLVFISALCGAFVLYNLGDNISELMNTVTETTIIPTGQLEIFTENPGF